MIFLLLILVSIVVYYYKFDFYDHRVALVVPWLVISILYFINISKMHVPLGDKAISVVGFFLLFYFLGGALFIKYKDFIARYVPCNVRAIPLVSFDAVFVFYLQLSFLNIVLAGYVPLVNLILYGDSKYMSFGISGLYGFYNAFANALGVLSYYLFLKTANKKYLFYLFLILSVFVLFMTRQNIISLVVEVFVVHGLVRKKITKRTVFVLSIVLLMVFSLLGDLRTSSIERVLQVSPDYSGLPSVIYWVYSYFYFSAMNLNSAVNFVDIPYYDFGSFFALVPNIVKNLLSIDVFRPNTLVYPNFTVSTAFQSMYLDFGFYEVIVLGFVFGVLGNMSYYFSEKNAGFLSVAIYSVLFFCALFSFFVNFWFYLPIIFQIPIFYCFSKMLNERHLLNPMP